MATAQTPPNNNDELVEFIEQLDALSCGYGITEMILVLNSILKILTEFSEMKLLSWTLSYLHKALGIISATVCILSMVQQAKIKNKLV